MGVMMRNPFENWFTGDVSLTTPDAPHEPAAVLRMLRAGWSYPRICQELFMSRFTLAYALKLAEDEEREAIRLGLPIRGQKPGPEPEGE